MNINPNELVEQITKGISDNVYTRGEAEADRTARHLADMQSDNVLAKNIRPYALIWAMSINTIIWLIQVVFEKEINDTIVITAGGILTVAFGFYFQSRKVEKINAKKSAATIQIEKLRTRQQLRHEKKLQRIERRDARRENR